MKSWNTDKIIGAGLTLTLLLICTGNFVVNLTTGVTLSNELPMNIVTGLAGYMGRSLLEKKKEGEQK